MVNFSPLSVCLASNELLSGCELNSSSGHCCCLVIQTNLSLFLAKFTSFLRSISLMIAFIIVVAHNYNLVFSPPCLNSSSLTCRHVKLEARSLRRKAKFKFIIIRNITTIITVVIYDISLPGELSSQPSLSKQAEIMLRFQPPLGPNQPLPSDELLVLMGSKLPLLEAQVS